jgi:hypothetical protein
MSNNNSWWEHHLTPAGWITNYVSYGFSKRTAPDRPQDAVETWDEHLTQRSKSSETFSTQRKIWESPDHSQEVRDSLRTKYPAPFHGYAPSSVNSVPARNRSSDSL